jgi:starvation-inducible DNA-binding protein
MKIDIGISEAHRQAITEGLSHLLADTYTLYMTTHNFHWNVTGPMFNSLHAMFMLQYTELWNAVDPIAERIRSLGYPAPGSYAQFAKLSSLPDARLPCRPRPCRWWPSWRKATKPWPAPHAVCTRWWSKPKTSPAPTC